jgi:DNA-binding MarR family transcriptional regulator
MTADAKPKSRRMVATKKPPQPYRLEEQIGFILRQASQRHVLIFGSMMPAGLTPTQFSVINMLDRLETCSQNQLGRFVAMDAATVKGVIDRLSAKGLMQIAPDPDDARQLLVSLTDDGRRLAADCVEAARRITGKTLAPLTAAEQKTLLALLKKIL